jgi:hypothetical protein
MKLSLALCVTIFGVVAAGTARSDPQHYLCVADGAAGAHYADDKTWSAQTFSTDSKYILRRLTDDDRQSDPTKAALADLGTTDQLTWGFFDMDGGALVSACTDKFACSQKAYFFQFDPASRHYEIAHIGSYAKPSSNATESVDDFIEIGTCGEF